MCSSDISLSHGGGGGGGDDVTTHVREKHHKDVAKTSKSVASFQSRLFNFNYIHYIIMIFIL